MRRHLWLLIGAICLLFPSWAIGRRPATNRERAAVVRGVAGPRYPPRCAVVYISTVGAFSPVANSCRSMYCSLP